MKARLLVVVSLAAGCATLGSAPTVSDEELSALGGKGLEPVEAARKEEAAAGASLAKRRAELDAARREVKIAELAIERDRADLEVARLRFEAAQETREADAMLPANARRTQAEQALASSQAELGFRKAARTWVEAQVDEAEAAHAVAVAAVERAKLGAILAGQESLTPEQEERRAGFDAEVAKARARLAEHGANVARVKVEMQAAEESWQRLATPRRASETTAAKP